MDALIALIEHLQKHYPVDPGRVSVTGMSMGGTGTWHLAVTYPNRFAAIAPVCGDSTWYVGDPAQTCAIRHIAVWAFHGEQDTVIPVNASQTLVNTLQTCGGNAHLTIFHDVGHNCWNQAYATPGLYTWLSDQRLS
jgi:predicted peptidase